MTDEKYQQLKEKYDKKCARVTELRKAYKLLREDYDQCDRSRDRALEKRDYLEAKNKILESMMPHNYFKIIYMARGYDKITGKDNGIMEFKDIISCCHPRIGVYEKKQNCDDFKLISIEKMG
jgi:hypothetical protein